MKRPVALLGAIIIAIAIFISCSSKSSAAADLDSRSQPDKNISYVQAQDDMVYTINPKTVEELEDASPHIVKGILKDDAQTKKYTTMLGSYKATLYQITVSTLQITKVYKGNLKEGNSIKLGERYYSVKDGDHKKVIYCGNYLPSETGKEYVFFLTDNKGDGEWWSGIYSPMLLERGRYPVPEQTLGVMKEKSVDSMSNEELNLGQDDSSEYKALYEQVKEKYMK